VRFPSKVRMDDACLCAANTNIPSSHQGDDRVLVVCTQPTMQDFLVFDPVGVDLDWVDMAGCWLEVQERCMLNKARLSLREGAAEYYE
jgi:hypothetical protein